MLFYLGDLSFLQDRWQRVKISTTFSSWTMLLQGISQGSVLGPILSHTHILNDIFFTLKGIDICNISDDTTPYACDSELKSTPEKLEHNFELTIARFEMNYMKFNTDKCHVLISRNKNKQMWTKLDKNIVWESNDIKLLGITIDSILKFDKHVSNICSKANRKLNA